jgi:hypothetical protein
MIILLIILMNKRGQATIFIIVGIVVVVVIALGIVFSSNIATTIGISEKVSFPPKIEDVKDMVQECVDVSAEEAVVNVGYTGGYYNLPDNVHEVELTLPYYYYDGNNLMPSLIGVENELEEYVVFLVDTCLEVDVDFDLEFGELSSDVSIKEGLVEFRVDYPFHASIEENEYNVDDFYESEINVDLNNVYNIASSIVQHDIENPDEISLDYLLNLGLDVSYVDYEDGNFVYILEDNTAFNEESTYVFMFASYFPIPEEYEEMSLEDYWSV